MATLGTLKNLADWAKEKDKTGKTHMVVELLSQSNEMLEDAMFKECNDGTGELINQRTGLPTTYWRLINQGVPNSKATVAQVRETTGMLTARSEIDRKLIRLNGGDADYRLSQVQPFLEAMMQEAASTWVYGSNANPEEFVGLANRYNDLSAANGQNILSAGGSGADNSSIWLLGWGDPGIYGIYPKGTTAGLSHEDLGEDDVDDASGNKFRAVIDLFEWDLGLALKDWRYVVRIPNIDISDLVGQTGTQALTASTSIIKLMARAIARLPSRAGITPVFYANRTVLSHLQVIGLEKSSSAVTVQDALTQFGETIQVIKFLGVPVRMMDTLTEAESVVA